MRLVLALECLSIIEHNTPAIPSVNISECSEYLEWRRFKAMYIDGVQLLFYDGPGGSD